MVADGCAFWLSRRPMYETSDWAESDCAVSESYSDCDVDDVVVVVRERPDVPEVPETPDVRDAEEAWEWPLVAEVALFE